MSDAALGARLGDTAARLTNSVGFAAAIAAAVVLPIALASIDNLPVGVAHDDGMYTVLAKSLATGHGYRWLNIPGEPRATHFPPGYPALLALVWHFLPNFPANVVAFKVVNAVLLAVVAAVAVIFVQRRIGLSVKAACLVAIAACASIPLLLLGNLVMSEVLFLSLLLPALLYAERVVGREAASPLADVGQAVLLALIGGALMLVRTHGAAFVVAVALGYLLRRRFRPLIVFLAASAVVALPWQLWQSAHRGVMPVPLRGDYESYGSWFRAGVRDGGLLPLMVRTVGATSREVFGMLTGLTTTGLPWVALRLFTVIVAIAVLCLGFWRLRRSAFVTVLFAGVYIAVVLLWPFNPARFLWGIWPILVFLFVAGGLAVRDWDPAETAARSFRLVVGAGWVLAVTGYGIYNMRGYEGRWWSSIGNSAGRVAVPTVQWVATHTTPNAIISTNAELMVYLYTGRLAVPATSFTVEDYFRPASVQARGDALRAILLSYPVAAVAIIANDSLELAARRMSTQQPPALSLRDSVPNGLIFSPAGR